MVQVDRFFKYMLRAHAQEMLQEGVLRIGTLLYYRASELGPAIGDADEGRSETVQAIEGSLDIARPENRTWVTNKLFSVGRNAKNVVLQDLSLSVPEQSADLHVYCASHRFSRRAMTEFNADACVMVSNPHAFVTAVVGRLRRMGIISAATLTPCDYSGRRRSETMPRVHPAVLKDASYSYQHEIRLIMTPTAAPPLRSFFVSIPEIRPLCRLLSEDEVASLSVAENLIGSA